jgi:hypothetical protein
MKTETQYRTFDELIDSVKIDMRTFDLEGMINPQELIKVVLRVNYELGLKVNPSRSKPIELYKGKAKLPNDFYVLNFALLCDGKTRKEDQETYKTYSQGVSEGTLIASQKIRLEGDTGPVRQDTIYTSLTQGRNVINHNLGTSNVVLQIFADDNTMLSFEVEMPNATTLYIYNESEVLIPNVKIVVIGAPDVARNVAVADLIGSPGKGAIVRYSLNGVRTEYTNPIVLRLEKSKSVSSECFNLTSRSPFSAALKNGFLVSNFDEGIIYLNYQSLMEDDQGNLLVLDHPLCNEYYEYAIKQRIYENLLMNGENVSNMMQLMEQRLRAARNNALSFMNTPDFADMRKIWELNRKAQYHNYFDMFKR